MSKKSFVRPSLRPSATAAWNYSATTAARGYAASTGPGKSRSVEC